MPAGFPFHYAMRGFSTPKLSYDSFEFRETVYPSYRTGHHVSPPVEAIVSFNYSSGSCGRRSKASQYLTWNIHIPGPGYHPARKHCPTSPIAHVQIDAALMNMPFGRFVRKSPNVVLHALSTSLELGVPITICVLDQYVAPLMAYSRTASEWQLGDVAYLATRPDGRQEVLHVAHQ
ncbi:hypothetical protein HGRIS_011284 [Hohenbuehelia grisea]|uniref:Uncharacterized protein n=1 Tax=Hohenbuehelia grisea TaxID=104357 RepID=A0ABR3JVF1_9AGAR